jgi:leucyl-tRNA synthetase
VTGAIDFDEPFARLLTQGMVQGLTYMNPNKGPAKISGCLLIWWKDPENPTDPETGEPLEKLYATMSKSKGNGVAPGDVLASMGRTRPACSFCSKLRPKKTWSGMMPTWKGSSVS